MPPKAARGTTTGRGRGRGRGKTTTGESSAPILPGQTIENHPIAATVTPALLVTTPVTTPQHLLDESAEPSPNSSPATIPTETPAPTPARAAISQSESTGFNVPSASSSSIGASRGGKSGARGAAAKTAVLSRFKPKNVRRDAGELEEIARKEHERLAAIAAENARAASKVRGRGRPTRGRGDAMGRGSGRKTTASGTFGVAPESLKTAAGGILKIKREGGDSGGGASGGPSGTSGAFNVKREGGGGGGGGGGSYSGPSGSGEGSNAAWVPEPQYPHDDDDVIKIDIEEINLISDEEDEPQLSTKTRHHGNANSTAAKGLRPVRLAREEHKERVLLVNTDTTVKLPPEDDNGGDAANDEERSPNVSKSARTFKGVYQDPDYPKVKDEPRATPEPSEPQVKTSPDTRRRTKDSLASTVPMVIDSTPDAETPEVIRKDPKPRAPIKKKQKKPVMQTEEDRAEWERHQDDVEILAKELGGLQGNLNADKGKGIARDGEGDVTMGDPSVADGEDQKEGNGRLYLFQFPPVLPELYNPKDPKPRNPFQLKRDQEEAAARLKEELEILGSIPKGKGKAKDNPEEPALLPKKEEEEEGIDAIAEKIRREEDERRKNKQAVDFVHEEGCVGKLVVRESGRVELIWGGTTLIVGRGAEASFLMTGVVVDSVERGPPGGGEPEGKATGMGQIMGKFVVTPDWQNY